MRVGAVALTVALAISASGADAAESFRRLRGADIKSRFAGMEFTDDVHWALVFGRDGNLSSFEMGAAGKGTWKRRAPPAVPLTLKRRRYNIHPRCPIQPGPF